MGRPVAHVEAGLRSFDRSMPEEINRILTDSISDLLFTTEPSGEENLLREGVAPEKIHFVGNVMIDTLFRYRERARQSDVLDRLALSPGGYAVLTLHRPSNVDDEGTLGMLLGAVARIQAEIPVVFPVHPRTRRRLEAARGRAAADARAAAGRPDAVPGLPADHGRGALRAHRLGRHPGGDHRACASRA